MHWQGLVKITTYFGFFAASQTPDQKISKPTTPATFPAANQPSKVLFWYTSVLRNDYVFVFLLQKGKGKKGNGVSTPFRRVEGDVKVDPRLVDNSFEAKV